MSQENMERTRQALDAFSRRDLDAYLAFLDPDIEFTPYEVAVQGGSPYRGHDGVRKWWEDSLAVFPDIRPEIDEIRDLGDMRMLVCGRLRGEGVGSGAAFVRPLFILGQWRDGKLIWWHNYESEAEALEAAALSE